MAWTPIDGRGLTLDQLRKHIDALKFDVWRPSGMTLHNTAAPTLAQWDASKAAQRIKNLEHYYKNQQGWPSGPHAFVDDVKVWLFTPFNRKGTHSPSWNGTRLGIEMVGDFSREDDDSGRGLKVKMNTVALFAMLHQKLGLDPDTIKLHKEDPRTTHNCPGKDIEKDEFIRLVHEYMGHAGDEDAPSLPIVPAPPPVPYNGTVKVPANDTLNMRERSSASSRIVASLKPNSPVEIIGEGVNRETPWLRVNAANKTGWVAARYITINN